MSNKKRTTALCASSIALTLAFSTAAFAQGTKMDMPMAGATAGQMTQKTLDENAEVAVTDVVAKPGETSPLQSRPMRVGYVVSGGTFERTYADEKKEVILEKAGETKLLDISKPYALKNIGKTTIHTIIVNLK